MNDEHAPPTKTPNTLDSISTKPCPFCGAPPSALRPTLSEADPPDIAVQCASCGARGPNHLKAFSTLVFALMGWNQRNG